MGTVKGAKQMTGHICYGVSDDCINIYSYGEICVRCGCCSAEELDEKKRIANQIEYYSERLEEEKNFSNWDDDEEWKKIQEKNVKENIEYFEQKIKELKEQKNEQDNV